MAVRAEAVDSGAVLASAAVLVALAVAAAVLVQVLEAAEPELVVGGREVQAAQKVVFPGSGSQRPRCCAGDPLREAARLAQAAEKAASPCPKKTCAPCSVCSRNLASRAKIPKRVWKCPHFNRA